MTAEERGAHGGLTSGAIPACRLRARRRRRPTRRGSTVFSPRSSSGEARPGAGDSHGRLLAGGTGAVSPPTTRCPTRLRAARVWRDFNLEFKLDAIVQSAFRRGLGSDVGRRRLQVLLVARPRGGQGGQLPVQREGVDARRGVRSPHRRSDGLPPPRLSAPDGGRFRRLRQIFPLSATSSRCPSRPSIWAAGEPRR